MARIIDDNKLELVKSTLINIIVKEGASLATISKVATEAGVSSGYLYRHYDSKESLLKDLYEEKFQNIGDIFLNHIQHNSTLESMINGFYTEIISLSKSNENEVLFLLKMMTDYSREIPMLNKNNLLLILENFKSKFKFELNPKITEEQIFTQVLGSILFFINMRKRGVFTTSAISSKEIHSISSMIIQALK